jgi:hypothetical protein
MNLRRVFWVILAFCANFKANAQKSVNFQTYYKKLTYSSDNTSLFDSY